MLVPTHVCAKVPDCVKVTSSEPTIPTKVPPVTVAVFVPSYSLFAIVAPVIVNGMALSASIISLEILVVLNEEELV